MVLGNPSIESSIPYVLEDKQQARDNHFREIEFGLAVLVIFIRFIEFIINKTEQICDKILGGHELSSSFIERIELISLLTNKGCFDFSPTVMACMMSHWEWCQDWVSIMRATVFRKDIEFAQRLHLQLEARDCEAVNLYRGPNLDVPLF